jgi:hypothetical protein
MAIGEPFFVGNPQVAAGPISLAGGTGRSDT